MNDVKNYGYIRSVDDLAKLAKGILADGRPIAFDIETGYLGPDRKKGSLMMSGDGFIVGFSFTVDPSWARYVPLRHDYAANLDPDTVWEIMFPLLDESKATRVVPHHAKFEKRYMRKEGIELGVLADTMMDGFVLSEWKEYGLKDMVYRTFDHKMTELIDLFPNITDDQKEAIRFNVLELTPEAVAYACEDSAWTMALFLRNNTRVQEERHFIITLENGLLPMMCDMEDRGIQVDWAGMEVAYNEADRFLPRLANEVRAGFEEATGKRYGTLNLNSTPQMRKVLYEDMKLPVGRMTKGGKKTGPQASTDVHAVKAFAKKYPAVKRLLELRGAEKLQDRLEEWLEKPKGRKQSLTTVVPIRGRDGRVHSSFAQARVGTGRFAASTPAVQNLQKDWFWAIGDAAAAYRAALGEGMEEDEARQAGRDAAASHDEIFEGHFRDFVVAGEGTYMLGFDYSQIELRAIAGLAKEQQLLDAFARRDDVHTLTAALMLGKRPQDITKRERPIGKTMNFALIYQMGVRSLADRLALPFDEAQRLYDGYFEQVPSIATWVENAKMTGKAQGYTVSYFGRKWTIWELAERSVSPAQYAHGERMAVNAPVQGWAADYMKVAMLRVYKALKANGWWGTKVWLTMNQHDALVFEVSEDLSPREVIDYLTPQVEFPIEGFPAIVAEWELGYRWGTGMHSIEPGDTIGRVDGRWVVGQASSEPTTEVLKAEATTTVVNMVSVAAMASNTSTTKTVVVSVPQMPTKEQFGSFLNFTTTKPGDNTVMLRTPQGEVELPETSGISLDDGGRIGVVLPGASVTYRAEDVDVESLATGTGL